MDSHLGAIVPAFAWRQPPQDPLLRRRMASIMDGEL
jgi:hypothetical protein